MSRFAKITLGCLIVLVAAAAFALVYTHAAIYSPEAEVPPSSAIAAAAVLNATSTDARPARLAIAAIGVDAAVEDLGVTTGDRMAMPSSFTQVGWYKYGPVPGANGTAVMYGHLDNGLGLSGVFKKLATLAPGDKVVTTSADGAQHTFVVDRVESYPYQAVPSEALTGSLGDTEAHLNLITCTGKWVYDSSMGMTYDHRLVVYTTLET